MSRLLTFLLVILLFSPFIVSVFAQDVTSSETITVEEKVEVKQEEEYTLPYPGILPDSPFYILKTGRDNLISFLISESKKKAEFNLLQADKRLQAGVYLIDKNKKYDLAEQTISKGENYFDQAITKLDEAKKQGTDISELEGKMKKAVKKHISVITDIEKKSPKDKKKLFTALRSRVEKLSARLASEK